MLYEIINPSDAYTFNADSFGVAVAAMLMVGEGKIGARPVGLGVPEDAPEMGPLFLMSEAQLDEWFKEKVGFPLEELSKFVDDNALKIASALESVVIGDQRGRELYLAKLMQIEEEDQRNAFKARWHDKHRSSINDIGKYCWAAGKGIRDRQAEEAEKGA